MVKRSMFLVMVMSLVVAFGAMVAGNANAGPKGQDGNSCSNINNGNVAIYTVKFTCGQQTTNDDDVVRGVYRTNVNIHNPQNQTVNFCTKVVLPDNASPTGITPLIPLSLDSDHSLFIDCYTTETGGHSIAVQLAADSITAPTTEFEGFVVIEVPQSGQNPTLLDVSGKYTARPGGDSGGSSEDVSSLQVVVYSPTLISNHHD